jgi:hypothetical protein
MGLESIFAIPRSERRIQELKLAFDSPPRYGKRLDWSGYSIHDAIRIMLLYLKRLPEPVIPPNYHERFYELERDIILGAQGPSFSPEEATFAYKHLINELPFVNRHVFLGLLNFLGVLYNGFISYLDRYELVALFQPVVFRYKRYPEHPHNLDVMKFLLTYSDMFCLEDPGRAMNEKPVGLVQNLIHTTKPRKLALEDALANRTLASPPPSRDITPADMWGAFLCTSNRSGQKPDSDVKISKVPRRCWAESVVIRDGDGLIPCCTPILHTDELDMQDQQSAHGSRFGDEFRSSDIDTPSLTVLSSFGVQNLEMSHSTTKSDFEGDEEGAVIENAAQKRANSSDLADDDVLPEQNDLSESIPDEAKEQTVIRSSDEPPKIATSHTEKALPKRLGQYFVEDVEPRVYSDSEITDISQLLLRLNPSWSRIPRVYIVLRIIGCLHAMSTFVDVGFSDYDFPVTARSLPPDLNPKARFDFVKNQTVVMTKSLNLEKREGGQHCFFRKNDYLPLQGQGILGVGGFGQVDKVLSLISFKKYARKRVLRATAFGGRNAAAQRAFIREIGILKRLKHDHIVEFVGSYTDHKYIAVLMQPIADMDLATYLQRADTTKHLELRTFFGCLSRALEFLHEQNIRHKDIKPQNILYETDRGVLLTDFGLSLDFTEASRSTTMGMVSGMTPTYCAPEVAAEEPRSTSSDIYSLGVVFLEMLVVLKGHPVEYLRTYFEAHGSNNRLIRKNDEALDGLLAELGNTAVVSDNKVLTWIEQMLRQNQKMRPTAASLSEWCTLADENGIRQFSGICCLSPDESYSETSDDYWDDGSDPP